MGADRDVLEEQEKEYEINAFERPLLWRDWNKTSQRQRLFVPGCGILAAPARARLAAYSVVYLCYPDLLRLGWLQGRNK